MNKNLKKRIYILALSSILLTGCNQNREIEDAVLEEDFKDDDLINDEEISSDEVNKEEIKESEVVTDDFIENTDTQTSEEILLVLPKQDFKSEEEVVDYFVKLKDDVEILLTVDDKTTDDKIDSRVMTFVEFMTEDVEIGGYSFNDLKEESKILIKTLYIDIDSMIESKKPNYKEKLKEKSKAFKDYCVYSYNIVKNQVIDWYNEGTLKENLYEGIFGGIDEDLENTKETFKDLFERAKEKIKNRNN